MYFTFLKRLYNFFWSMYKIQNILNFPKSCCQINFKIHKINFPLYFTFLQQLRVALTWQFFNPAVLGCSNVCCNVMVFHHETYSEAMSHLKTLCIGIKLVYKNNNFSGWYYEKKKKKKSHSLIQRFLDQNAVPVVQVGFSTFLKSNYCAVIVTLQHRVLSSL